MPTPFPNQIKLIVDGQDVDAVTTNAPINQLAQRTEALKEAIDNARIGTANLLRDVPIASDAVPGMAVYKDANGVFRPGRTDLQTAADGGSLVLGDSSFVWGVVYEKSNPSTGDIVLNGLIQITESQLEAITLSGTVETGLLFLVGTLNNDGKVTSSRPPIGVPVMYVRGPAGLLNGENLYDVLVDVSWNNPFEDHIHYRVSLDKTNFVDLATWQAANPGLIAPAGFDRRYDNANDPNLANIWPPVPIESAALFIDGVLAQKDTKWIIDDTGLWWEDTGGLPTAATYLDFYFSKLTFKTNDAVVSSLTPANESIKITDPGGVDATVGNLLISVNGTTLVSDTDDEGQALKSVDGFEFTAGPVVDGIRAGGSSLVISGGSTFDVGGQTFYKGRLTLELVDPNMRGGTITTVNLDGVELAEEGLVTFLTFPEGRQDARIIAKIKVPETLPAGTYTISMEAVARFPEAGTIDPLEVTGEMYAPTLSEQDFSPLPISVLTGLFDGLTTTQPNQFLTDAVTLGNFNPGDVIFVAITREATSYGSNIDIIDLSYNLGPL